MQETIAGINESEVSELSLEVLDYADRMSEIFDKIDACITELPSHYQGHPCTELMNRYQELRASFNVIMNNIKSYSDDLNALIQKMSEDEKKLATLFDQYTDDTVKHIKSDEPIIR